MLHYLAWMVSQQIYIWDINSLVSTGDFKVLMQNLSLAWCPLHCTVDKEVLSPTCWCEQSQIAVAWSAQLLKNQRPAREITAVSKMEQSSRLSVHVFPLLWGSSKRPVPACTHCAGQPASSSGLLAAGIHHTVFPFILFVSPFLVLGMERKAICGHLHPWC